MKDKYSELGTLANAMREMNRVRDLIQPSAAALAASRLPSSLDFAVKAVAEGYGLEVGMNTLRLASGAEFDTASKIARAALGHDLGITRLADLGVPRSAFDQIGALKFVDPMQSLSSEMAKRLKEAERTVIDPFKYDGLAASAVADIMASEKAFMAAAFPNSLSQIQTLASAAAAMVPSHSRFETEGLWQKSLVDRIGAIDGPWAAAGHFDRSAFAFGSLARLSDTLAFDAPFSVATRGYVEEEFGEVVEFEDEDTDREKTYGEAGRDPALVAFPAGEYPSILRAAGFYEIEIPLPTAPQPIANGEGISVFSAAHESTLRSLELHMRFFIETQLRAATADWEKQRVPGDILNRWKERQEACRAAGSPVYDLIHYADFNDLAQIITQKNNWNGVFKAVFGDKDGVQVSLRRLSPLRNNNAHLRPFTPSELLFLVAEATRLLRAIGVVRTH